MVFENRTALIRRHRTHGVLAFSETLVIEKPSAVSFTITRLLYIQAETAGITLSGSVGRGQVRAAAQKTIRKTWNRIPSLWALHDEIRHD
jgi:hypothetical protein